MASDPPARAVAEPGPSSEDLARLQHGNQQHGLYAKKALIRALLPPGEAEAWDQAPVPSDCPPVLEEIFREYCVLKYRVHAWEQARKPAEAIAELSARLRAYHIPLRGLIKAVEVHARLKEAEQTHDMGDAVLAYLRTLPAHRLEDYMLEQEAPRFDPVSGRLLTDVSHETVEEESHHDGRDGPNGPRHDPGTPDPGGPEPGGGP
ncbi:MAG: hypothetical protein V3T71_02475 [Dehalococcoidia bacterium]